MENHRIDFDSNDGVERIEEMRNTHIERYRLLPLSTSLYLESTSHIGNRESLHFGLVSKFRDLGNVKFPSEYPTSDIKNSLFLAGAIHIVTPDLITLD